LCRKDDDLFAQRRHVITRLAAAFALAVVACFSRTLVPVFRFLNPAAPTSIYACLQVNERDYTFLFKRLSEMMSNFFFL